MKNKGKLFAVILLLFLSLFCFCGCQSISQDEAYFNSEHFEQATFNFDEESNQTKVIVKAAIKNNTIYNIKDFSLTVNLYKDVTLVTTETYDYTISIKNGKTSTWNLNFSFNGEIDSIEYVSCSTNYSSFWDTYKIWLIVSAVLLVISFVIYVIVMIVEDLEINDVFISIIGFFQDYGWTALILLIPFGGTVWAILSSHWVPVLIVFGAIISFIILCLLANLIKYIIEECSYGSFGCFGGRLSQVDLKEDSEKEFFDNQNDTEVDFKKDNKQKESPTQKTNSLEELNNLIGLESVKIQLKRIRATLLKNKDSNEQLNLHMCFYGNPGTGKTVVARLMANIFYEAGILPTNKLIETDRSGLCGQYVGQTAPLTHQKVKQALGGILFIDEAYTLYSDSTGEDYGKEAIAALLKDMEDYKGKFCVILAGYKDEMEKMIALNPGFDSRINRKIDFPDYTLDEQMQIFNLMLLKKNYEITEEARKQLSKVFEKQSKSKQFANARTIRNILETLIEIQALRTLADDNPQNDTERIIKIEDIEQYEKEH